MRVRQPAVAGQFYPGTEAACRAEIEALLSESARDAGGPAVDFQPDDAVGGIVPHAGWICSGAVAAEVIAVLAEPKVDTFVVFGAAHRLRGERAVVSGGAAWATPLGEVDLDAELASAVVAACEAVDESAGIHAAEHSIEVQVPFIQHEAPGARLLPILVPHRAPARAIGRAVAEQARRLGRSVVCLGSTDLTHYGPRYGFVPEGVGEEALRWAKEVNDRGIVDLICRMESDRVVPEAVARQSACGAGAVAATIEACRHLGASRGVLLRHVTSAEVLGERLGPMTDAVGYAGVMFVRSP